MSRMQTLVQRPKRTLAALATVLVAVGLTTASGANFNATSANAANTFAAGTMSIGNSNSSGSTSILTASNMRPADPATVGTVDITNTGSLSGAFTLSKGTLTDTPGAGGGILSTQLDAVILDCGAWTVTAPDCVTGTSNVYTGTLSAMSTNYVLGTFAAGVKHRYQFSVALNGSANNSFQGSSTTAQFVWNAS